MNQKWWYKIIFIVLGVTSLLEGVIKSDFFYIIIGLLFIFIWFMLIKKYHLPRWIVLVMIIFIAILASLRILSALF